MAFPSSPSNGDTHEQNGVIYTYDSTYSTWSITGSPGIKGTFDRYDNKSLNVKPEDGSPYDCAFKPDGKIAYIIGTGSKAIYQYTLSTA